jgi:glycosyltransferase involved in cell wall biosynthesis
MKDQPLVSIIYHTYNHALFVNDAIEGFLKQKTDYSFEILIHDDASNDGTAEIIREFEQKNPELIKSIIQKENQFSKGIRPWISYLFPLARGKYIAVCDGDDYWTDPLKLQKQVGFLEGNPEYSMCFHRVKVIAPAHLKYKETLFSHLEDRDYSGKEILQNWTIPNSSVVFRSEFKDVMYELVKKPAFMYFDILLYLNLAEFGKIRCINQPMGIYRIHDQGLSIIETNDKKELKFAKHLKAIQKEFGGKYLNVNNHVIAWSYGSYAYKLLRKGRLINASRFLILSFWYDPSFLAKKIFSPKH